MVWFKKTLISLFYRCFLCLVYIILRPKGSGEYEWVMKYKCTEVTRNKIKRAFLELTNLKPVNKIFVKEIIQFAGISRACFYVHYENIAALIREIGKDTINAIINITQEKKYTADMSHEILCNRACAQYLQENKDTVAILISVYGDPAFLQEWYTHVKLQIISRLEKDQIPINHEIEDMVEFAMRRVFDTILQNLQNPFDEVFKALNIMDKFMVCLVVSMHYSKLEL